VGPLLNGGWPAGAVPIDVVDAAAVSVVREAVRREAAAAGLARERAESLVAAASEIAHNQIAHAGRGEVLVRPVSRRGAAGVEVMARDRGPGIRDPAAALRAERNSASTGLGVGLSAAYGMADEIDWDVRWGEGTLLCARKFVVPIARSEVAIFGRACAGETTMGDDALFARDDGGLLCAVADGLGHGPLASAASGRAMEVVRASTSRSPAELIRRCWQELGATRGSVMAIEHIDDGARALAHAGLGNVMCHLYLGRTTVRLPSTPGVVGARGPRPRLQDDVAPLHGRYVLVMFTDGISSRVDLSNEAELLRQPPIVIAQRLLNEHGRDHDDALVLVATG